METVVIAFIVIAIFNIIYYSVKGGQGESEQRELSKRRGPEKPMFNVDGSLMVGDFDTNGNPYGVGKMHQDSHSQSSDHFHHGM